jgi:hypothetical protein
MHCILLGFKDTLSICIASRVSEIPKMLCHTNTLKSLFPNNATAFLLQQA